MLKIFIISLLAMNTYASVGNDAGGGGKTEELEFAQVARLFSANIEQSRKTEDYFKDLDFAAFQSSLVTTEIRSKEHLCTPDGCLDAQYLASSKIIEINLRSWKKKTCLEKMGLVVHEYGRAAGIEDGNYRYSALVRMSNTMSNACAIYDGFKNPNISINDNGSAIFDKPLYKGYRIAQTGYESPNGQIFCEMYNLNRIGEVVERSNEVAVYFRQANSGVTPNPNPVDGPYLLNEGWVIRSISCGK